MLDMIKNINPEKLSDVKELQNILALVLNVLEKFLQENAELKEQVRQLQDELSKLKGGNARPVIKASVKTGSDISSKGREHGIKRDNQDEDKETPKEPVAIDKEIKVEMKASDLPSDAIFKGYVEYTQQDLVIGRNNKKFLFATWYSPSQGKTFKASWPGGEVSGHYGPGVRSLVNILHHYANVTHSSIEGLLQGLGIQISAGSISNLLKAEHDWVIKEQRCILQAALHRPEPKQMDSTGNRQRGVNKVTHIITASFFSVFYTLNTKSRIDCLRALQGNPQQDLQLMWHEDISAAFQQAGVGKSEGREVIKLLQSNGAAILSINEFEELLKLQAAHIYKKTRVLRILIEVMALYYYSQQEEFPGLKLLLSDDAPEYKKIAKFHALCWVHDARYYNKLMPQTGMNIGKLEAFKTTYWNFYQTLLDYKSLSLSQQNEQKEQIRIEFDKIFGQTTQYGALDLCMKRTRDNKEELLRVLDFPDLPLHNNAAELAARRVVRKRDISLHTWSYWGTQLRDAFLSIIETSKKLGISAFQYINDRITRQSNMPSLSDCILLKSARTM